MTDTPPELALLLERSAAMHDALDTALVDAEFDVNIRTEQALATSELAIEHGVSICLIVGARNLASANVLLRAQFEAVTRGLWLTYVATQDWFERYIDAVRANPTKHPNQAPDMDKMLAGISQSAPPVIAPQLMSLKVQTWGVLNSFVHAGIHPTTLIQTGYPLDAAIGTVSNANALTTMAFATMAAHANRQNVMHRLSELQLGYRDCLPPMEGPASTVQ
jgi:hypothetical protein